MKEERFERLIHGLSFKGNRLKELQEKSIKKGLKGDEVFEFIYLDRKELSEKIEKLESNLAKVVKCVRHYAGKPFKTNGIYMNIFDLFKVENSSVTSFDSDKFSEHARKTLEEIGEES